MSISLNCQSLNGLTGGLSLEIRQGGISLNIAVLTEFITDPTKFVLSLFDILIVAYLFYRLLLLIRGTRAEQLLKGLLLLLVFSIGSRYLHLEVVGWLMEKMWTMLFVALPVVFQPELRRALEQLGRGHFFAAGARWTDRETVIEEIVKAVDVLSRTRTGALIIVERETGIKDHIESGVPLDALVSASLLVSIFTPKTPLHDGAVVISEGRIMGAGCFLPLSDNPNLEADLGTRHRAGVGITEVSDAIAIIVSEETGAISLAIEGKLARGLDTLALKQRLEEELGGRDRKSEVFKILRWPNERE